MSKLPLGQGHLQAEQILVHPTAANWARSEFPKECQAKGERPRQWKHSPPYRHSACPHCRDTFCLILHNWHCLKQGMAWSPHRYWCWGSLSQVLSAHFLKTSCLESAPSWGAKTTPVLTHQVCHDECQTQSFSSLYKDFFPVILYTKLWRACRTQKPAKNHTLIYSMCKLC